MKVKDAASAAQKFVTNGAQAAGAYKTGVTGAGPDWANNTAAAADNWAAGTQAAIGRGAFAKGVNAAGPSKYVANASGVGAQRYPQGIQNAGPAWQKGAAPFLQVLSGLSLSPRRPKGDPGNMARVSEVAQALRAAKVGA